MPSNRNSSTIIFSSINRMFGFAKRLAGSTAIAGAALYATFNNVDMWTIMMFINVRKAGWMEWLDGWSVLVSRAPKNGHEAKMRWGPGGERRVHQ